MLQAVLNHVNFACRVPHNDVLLIVEAMRGIHQRKVHFLPKTMILEDSLGGRLVEVRLNQLLNLMMN